MTITVEPITAFSNAAAFAEMLASVNPVQVNVGANSSKTVRLPESTKAEVEALIEELGVGGIMVHQKSNLSRLLK